ncbi:MAG TPA: DUF1203 domain-containing protein [Allosphingosinicella sp.]|nr:DUF1203 domain-containing protein [Allosphingosinicella sp.]
MAYRIEGLDPEPFAGLFDLSDAELAARNARRVRADSPTGHPCRVSLREAVEGEELLLINHVSNEAPTPFRAAHAIYVRKGAQTGRYADAVPPLFVSRTLSLRAFDRDGMLRDGVLAGPGEADAGIRALFERDEIDTIHAHSAAYGCFLARIERS